MSPLVSRALPRVRFRGAVEQLRASLWLVPTVFVAAAVALAGSLNRVTVEDSSPISSFLFPSGAASARAVLQAIAGSVITVTGVVFSLTVVTLQLASTQFSPRLLRTFLRDLSNQVVLGIFLATFTYALVALRAVRSGETAASDVVPAAAVTGAYVLAGASVAALVYFIDHISRSIRIDSLMREVNEDTLKVIDLVHPDGAAGPSSAPPPDPPRHAVPVPAASSGFIQDVDHEWLLDVAVRHHVTIRLEVPIGERVIAGSPLARVWQTAETDGGAPTRAVSQELQAAIRKGVQVGYERTMQQDVAFGFRQLVDVAVKALSPGVNDPTTAVHALGHLTAMLAVLVGRVVSPLVRRDGEGDVRVILPVVDLPGYLDLACGQIRRYGAAEPAVTTELLRLLLEVARRDPRPADAAAVAREAELVVVAAERETPESRDLEPLHALHAHVQRLLDAHDASVSGRSGAGATPGNG